MSKLFDRITLPWGRSGRKNLTRKASYTDPDSKHHFVLHQYTGNVVRFTIRENITTGECEIFNAKIRVKKVFHSLSAALLFCAVTDKQRMI